MALVIGKGGRHIKAEHALDHVAGYTCFVDGSVRDYQKFSVTSGKNFPGTGPLGPWLVTTDEIPDPSRLTLTTRLNSQQVQHATTDQLIYSIPQIIAFCSDFTALSPGDVIATGTPEGVGHGRKPPLWMKPGDVLEVEISGIGVLRTRIVDERSPLRCIIRGADDPNLRARPFGARLAAHDDVMRRITPPARKASRHCESKSSPARRSTAAAR